MNNFETNKFYRDSIKGKINDSANQFGAFKYFKNEQEIKDLIKENPLVSLEDYLSKTTEEIDKEKPGICEKYNDFVKEFMDPNISYDRIKYIINEVFKLTHNL